MIFEILALVTGIFFGMLMGLLPGIGAAMLMLLMYPVLLLSFVDIWVLMCFYLGIVNSGQYYGSVSASVFGVIGESSSLPAVKNGYPLTLKGRGPEVLASASSASYIAVLISMFFTSLIVLLTPESLLFMMKGRVVFFMLCATSLALILNSGKFLLSLIFLCLGIVASLVGWDDFFETRILTFGISQLDGGLPMVPLFSGLLLVPIALKSISQRHESKPHISILSLRERLLFLKRYLYNPSVLRGTMIGFFSGFVPGSGYTASSNLADSIEKRYCLNKSDDDQKLSRLVSAEAANNAGSISVLVPLLMFGLPIVFSEAIFMGVAEVKGFSYSYSYEWFINNWLYIVTILLIVNTFNWLIAGVFFDLVLKVYDSCKHWIYHFLIAFSLFIMLYLAYNESRILLSLIVFGLSLIIGMIISHTSSKYTFVYGYFVSELIVDEVYRMIF